MNTCLSEIRYHSMIAYEDSLKILNERQGPKLLSRVTLRAFNRALAYDIGTTRATELTQISMNACGLPECDPLFRENRQLMLRYYTKCFKFSEPEVYGDRVNVINSAINALIEAAFITVDRVILEGIIASITVRNENGSCKNVSYKDDEVTVMDASGKDGLTFDIFKKAVSKLEAQTNTAANPATYTAVIPYDAYDSLKPDGNCCNYQMDYLGTGSDVIRNSRIIRVPTSMLPKDENGNPLGIIFIRSAITFGYLSMINLTPEFLRGYLNNYAVRYVQNIGSRDLTSTFGYPMVHFDEVAAPPCFRAIYNIYFGGGRNNPAGVILLKFKKEEDKSYSYNPNELEIGDSSQNVQYEMNAQERKNPKSA